MTTTHHLRRISTIATLLVLTTSIGPLRAAPLEFTVDEAQSKITLSGSVLGITVQEQGPGSLTTTFYGKILAEVSGAGIQFPGGSALTARTNGVWQPGAGGAAGTAPADYAAQAPTLIGTLKGAVRNVVLDVTSGVLPLTNGQFDAASLLFGFVPTSGASFDYDAGFLGAKGIALSGISTNQIVNGASLTTVGASQVLSILIDTEFKFRAAAENDSSVRLKGQLIATQAPQPTITSIEINNQTVTLHVSGAGDTPRLDSSADLKSWTTQAPARSTDARGVVLTLPTAGPMQFYRVAK